MSHYFGDSMLCPDCGEITSDHWTCEGCGQHGCDLCDMGEWVEGEDGGRLCEGCGAKENDEAYRLYSALAGGGA